MASFDFDQAEGLRRMLAGPKPRVVSFVSATSDAEKNAMLVNLGASLASTVSDVLLLDAGAGASGIASRLRAGRGATLLDAVQRNSLLEKTVHATEQGFQVATLGQFLHSEASQLQQDAGLASAFGRLAQQSDVVIVDAVLDEEGDFPLKAMAVGEIVIQVSAGAESIKHAYGIIKRLNVKLGRRPFGVLVTGASEKEAQRVFANMAQAASRYLAVTLHSVGSVPADEHLVRAACLGRSVIDAFPMASASVAFRSLAGRLSDGGLLSATAGAGA